MGDIVVVVVGAVVYNEINVRILTKTTNSTFDLKLFYRLKRRFDDTSIYVENHSKLLALVTLFTLFYDPTTFPK